MPRAGIYNPDETAGQFHMLQFLSPNIRSIRLSARSPRTRPGCTPTRRDDVDSLSMLSRR